LNFITGVYASGTALRRLTSNLASSLARRDVKKSVGRWQGEIGRGKEEEEEEEVEGEEDEWVSG
jgi:hypothetical protein